MFHRQQLLGLCIVLNLLVASAAISLRGAGALTLYSTQFERAQGYNRNLPLIGQRGWVGTIAPVDDLGSSGLVADFFAGEGQQAYIGFSPLPADETALSLWQPLNVAPDLAQNPVVRFSVLMGVWDSSENSPRYDCFRWSVYNTNEQRLFSLDFDNANLEISYLLENGQDWISTDYGFDLETPYLLTMLMDFGRNLWSASMGDTIIVTNQPMTTAHSALHLGDIDAVWVYGDGVEGGDNFMVFDNYVVQAEPRAPPAPPEVIPLGPLLDGRFLLWVGGEPNRDYAVEVTSDLRMWDVLAVENTYERGSFFYLDETAPDYPTGFYRVVALE